MDRKRSVLAASGVSAVLLVGSSAFAVANGIFVSKAVHPAATFQGTKAPIVSRTLPVATSPIIAAPPRVSSVAPNGSSPQYPVAPPERFTAPMSVPAIQPAIARTITHSGASAVSAAPDDDREPAGGVERDD